jgi:hypothetical protein
MHLNCRSLLDWNGRRLPMSQCRQRTGSALPDVIGRAAAVTFFLAPSSIELGRAEGMPAARSGSTTPSLR